MKECTLCGNKKAKELEKVLMFSDGDGIDGESFEWICKEEKGCNEQ